MRHSTLRRPAILALGLVLSTGMLATAVPVAAAGSGCLVKDSGTGKTYGKLQKAVDNAAANARIEVRGTCTGSTIVAGKTLKIVGVPTKTRGKPVLSGGGAGRVLEVQTDANVILQRITLRNGRVSGKDYPGNSGAAILVSGRVTLLSSVVRDNKSSGSSAGSGAIEVLDTGTLVVAESSEIKNNVGVYGGAIENYGKTTIRDSASIHDNKATKDGGAIYNGNSKGTDTLTIQDNARIEGNQAVNGGAIAIGKGALILKGTPKIKQNTASAKGGGIFTTGGTLTGVKCGKNVVDNTPDQVSPKSACSA